MWRSRGTFITLTLTMGLLLAGCSNNSVPIFEKDAVSLSDTVAALRISPQLADMNDSSKGYVVLVSDDGAARAVEVGPMDVGKLAWTKSGLFFSGPTEEYVLSPKGLKSLTRVGEEQYETARFIKPSGDRFIALYNVGFGNGYYQNRVVTGNISAIRSWQANGLYSSISQCDDAIVGITDIAETRLSSAMPPSQTEALMQLYPKPDDEEAALLATIDVDGEYVEGQFNAPCIDNISYTLSFHSPRRDDPSSGVPVLRSWNISTGHHSEVPLVDEVGNPLKVTSDDIGTRSDIITEDTYRWISQSGTMFNTDLKTGVTTQAYKIALSSPEMMGQTQLVLTPESIFVLDVSADQSKPMDLSKYDLITGERTSLLTVSSLGAIYNGDMILRDMALDPEWIAQHE
ncbi:MAG: hypothetical protein QM705_03445 [Ancrocorticia sp.]